jgi:hypothetical protein
MLVKIFVGWLFTPFGAGLLAFGAVMGWEAI